MRNRNPYAGHRSAILGANVATTGKKPPPPPAPPKKTDVSRQARLVLDTFVYNCKQCGEERTHSIGYLFVVLQDGEWLYFCNVNCCDEWEKFLPPGTKPDEPVPDRRGAIAATKAKNAT